MKKALLSVNIVFFVLICAGNFIFTGQGGIGPFSATAVKGITSGFFALLGIVNSLYMLKAEDKKLAYGFSVAAGLAFSMLGDILLGVNFIVGAGVFALGHVMYFISYCFLAKPGWRDLIFGGVIFVAAAMFVILFPHLHFDPPIFKWVCVAYALVISFMVGKAISNYAHGMSVPGFVMALGSILFFFSDLMLVVDWFIGTWDPAGNLCMATYYPAQWLLAFSVFLVASKKTEH